MKVTKKINEYFMMRGDVWKFKLLEFGETRKVKVEILYVPEGENTQSIFIQVLKRSKTTNSIWLKGGIQEINIQDIKKCKLISF